MLHRPVIKGKFRPCLPVVWARAVSRPLYEWSIICMLTLGQITATLFCHLSEAEPTEILTVLFLSGSVMSCMENTWASYAGGHWSALWICFSLPGKLQCRLHCEWSPCACMLGNIGVCVRISQPSVPWLLVSNIEDILNVFYSHCQHEDLCSNPNTVFLRSQEFCLLNILNKHSSCDLNASPLLTWTHQVFSPALLLALALVFFILCPPKNN